ncbi:MAG: hypothetical protein OXF02_03035 [Simkaniaceae bacterium]|nr:hypothetical protein [Simkaniaceae bacterium]
MLALISPLHAQFVLQACSVIAVFHAECSVMPGRGMGHDDREEGNGSGKE